MKLVKCIQKDECPRIVELDGKGLAGVLWKWNCLLYRVYWDRDSPYQSIKWARSLSVLTVHICNAMNQVLYVGWIEMSSYIGGTETMR